MKCLGCGAEIKHYLQVKKLIPIKGWVEMEIAPLQGCADCIPPHDGIWEGEE